MKRKQPKRRRYVLCIPNYSRKLDGPLHARPAEEVEIPGRFRTKVGARKKYLAMTGRKRIPPNAYFCWR